MKELSLHIMDLVQNALNAKADRIEITIDENRELNEFIIKISDNGMGMNSSTLKRVSDPFFTTGNKKTGLGLPLMKQHAQAAGGDLQVVSAKGKGATVTASFVWDHIDRQPLGNISATVTALIRSNTEIQWIYIHRIDGREFRLDSLEVKQNLNGLQLGSRQVIEFLKELIDENIELLTTG